jgi:hypothetical protein
MLSTTLTYTLLLSLARLAIGAPAPVRESADSDLAKRQNAPDFGGWNEGQNVTELIFELNQQVTPIDRDIKLPADGFVFNFMEANSFGGGGKDGGVILADNTLFPGVVGNSMSWLVGFLGVSRETLVLAQVLELTVSPAAWSPPTTTPAPPSTS